MSAPMPSKDGPFEDPVLVSHANLTALRAENTALRDLVGEVWTILTTRSDPMKALAVLNERAPTVLSAKAVCDE